MGGEFEFRFNTQILVKLLLTKIVIQHFQEAVPRLQSNAFKIIFPNSIKLAILWYFYETRRKNLPTFHLFIRNPSSRPTRIIIVLAHNIYSLRLDVSLHPDMLSWFLASPSLFLLVKDTCLATRRQMPFYSLELDRPGLEPTIYYARGESASNYITDTVIQRHVLYLYCYVKVMIDKYDFDFHVSWPININKAIRVEIAFFCITHTLWTTWLSTNLNVKLNNAILFWSKMYGNIRTENTKDCFK